MSGEIYHQLLSTDCLSIIIPIVVMPLAFHKHALRKQLSFKDDWIVDRAKTWEGDWVGT